MKWVALFLVLLPLAWPTTRPAEVSGRSDPYQACQEGDAPAALTADQFALQAFAAPRYLTIEGTEAPPDALDLSSLNYRGPPTH